MITADWSKFNNITITNTFIDEGYTARTFDRPDINNLFLFIKENFIGIDYLLVSELTRFSREAGDAINMVKHIQKKYNIKIVSCSRGAIYDCHDHNSFFMMGLEFLLGNSENIKRQNDINGGIYTAKAKEGRWIQGGPAPFGYQKEGIGKNRRLVIDPQAASIVRYIFNAYIKNTPIYCIKDDAKKMGMKRTSNSIIHNILRNPLYIGLLKVKPYKEMPGGLFPGKHEAIIDNITWQQAQDRLNKKTGPRIAIADEMPLRGVLHCSNGKLLTGAPSKNRIGKYYYYYKCQPICCKTNISVIKAHQQLNEMLGYMSLPHHIINAIRSQSIIEMETKTKDDAKQIMQKRTRLSSLEIQLKSVEEKWINNQLTHDSYIRWYSDLHNEISTIKQEIEKLTRDKNELYLLLHKNIDRLQDMQQIYNISTTLQKQELIRQMFDNTLYYKDNTYRTHYLMHIFHHKLMILNKKRLLILDEPPQKSNQVEATGILSNIAPFLSFIQSIKVA
jgi:DNA invertase Pin-like site-specific DNA recombinase